MQSEELLCGDLARMKDGFPLEYLFDCMSRLGHHDYRQHRAKQYRTGKQGEKKFFVHLL
jgi:hypothetical protein